MKLALIYVASANGSCSFMSDTSAREREREREGGREGGREGEK